MKRYITIFFLLVICSVAVFAQFGKISGKVKWSVQRVKKWLEQTSLLKERCLERQPIWRVILLF